jgi:hypothetical protein
MSSPDATLRVAFPEYGIECLQQIVADERAAGNAPPKANSPD